MIFRLDASSELQFNRGTVDAACNDAFGFVPCIHEGWPAEVAVLGKLRRDHLLEVTSGLRRSSIAAP